MRDRAALLTERLLKVCMKLNLTGANKRGKLIFDIGVSNLKIMEAEERHGFVTVQRSSLIKLPENAFTDGVLTSPAKIADAIAQELSASGYKAKPVVLTITSSQILTREVILPKSSLKDMMLLVEADAPNHFPVDISEYSVDFKVLGEVSEDNLQQYKVLLIVTPLKILDSYVAVFEKCGLYLEKIDYKGNSLTKLVRQIDDIQGYYQEGSTAVIDIGDAHSSVTICKDGYMKFSRVFNFGSKLYSDELLEFPGVTGEIAERIKKEKGVILDGEEDTDDYARAARQAWSNFGDPLLDEITRVFDFFTSRESVNMIDRILLTGGGSMMPRLIRYFSSVFDVHVDYLRCEGLVEFVSPDEDMTMFSMFFGCCVGALLSE